MQPSVTEEQVAETMEWLRATLQSGVDFTAEQAPLWAEEMLRYGAFQHSVWFWIMLGVTVLLLLVASALFFIAIKHEYLEPVIVLSIAVLAFVSITSGVVIYHGLELKKIEHAPRVYLLENLPRF